MSAMFEEILGTLGGDATRAIGSRVGADDEAVGKVLSGALPTLLGALQRNSASTEGSQALADALDRDHDGSILGDLAGRLGQGPSRDGDAILGHVLGERRPAVENGLGRMSGLDAGSVGEILNMLAPLIMGFLGREKRRRGYDASALTGFLQGEQRAALAAQPEVMGILGRLLDADGDGQVADDVIELGGSLLGKLFSGK